MNREFPIKTRVRFLWRDPDGALRVGVGTTQRISRTSVSIQCEQVPFPGASVQVVVEMPPARADSQAGQLVGAGLAMRQEYALGQLIGFSAAVRFRPRWAYSNGNSISESSVRESAALAVMSRTRQATQTLGGGKASNFLPHECRL